jgi:hypothetical protein
MVVSIVRERILDDIHWYKLGRVLAQFSYVTHIELETNNKNLSAIHERPASFLQTPRNSTSASRYTVVYL